MRVGFWPEISGKLQSCFRFHMPFCELFDTPASKQPEITIVKSQNWAAYFTLAQAALRLSTRHLRSYAFIFNSVRVLRSIECKPGELQTINMNTTFCNNSFSAISLSCSKFRIKSDGPYKCTGNTLIHWIELVLKDLISSFFFSYHIYVRKCFPMWNSNTAQKYSPLILQRRVQ